MVDLVEVYITCFGSYVVSPHEAHTRLRLNAEASNTRMSRILAWFGVRPPTPGDDWLETRANRITREEWERGEEAG